MENDNPNIHQVPEPVQVRTYTMNHPPLAPLVSQADDRPAAAIMVGDVMMDDHIAAASQQHILRTALMASRDASPIEVVQSKKRETGILLESLSVVPIGQDWAQNLEQRMIENNAALLQGMNTLQNVNNAVLLQGMNTLQTDLRREMNVNNAAILRVMNESNADLRHSLAQLSIVTARNTNRSVLANQTIAPVPNIQGNPPPPNLFPQTLVDIATMTLPNVQELLQFYGVEWPPQATLDDKIALLCTQLGVTLQVRN